MTKTTITQELPFFKQSDYDLSFVKNPRKKEISNLDYLALGALSAFLSMDIFLFALGSFN